MGSKHNTHHSRLIQNTAFQIIALLIGTSCLFIVTSQSNATWPMTSAWSFSLMSLILGIFSFVHMVSYVEMHPQASHSSIVKRYNTAMLLAFLYFILGISTYWISVILTLSYKMLIICGFQFGFVMFLIIRQSLQLIS